MEHDERDITVHVSWMLTASQLMHELPQISIKFEETPMSAKGQSKPFTLDTN